MSEHPGHTIRCMKEPVYRAIVAVMVAREKEHRPEGPLNQGWIGSVAKRIVGALRAGHYLNDDEERKRNARVATEIGALRSEKAALEGLLRRARRFVCRRKDHLMHCGDHQLCHEIDAALSAPEVVK